MPRSSEIANSSSCLSEYDQLPFHLIRGACIGDGRNEISVSKSRALICGLALSSLPRSDTKARGARVAKTSCTAAINHAVPLARVRDPE